MNIVVVGAAGQLGRALAELAAKSHTVAAWTRQDLDLTRPDQVDRALRAAAPDVIFNCAAYNNVDGAEDEPVTALAINAWAVRDLARTARAIGATFVHYSTDFVFDGTTAGPYDETAPTNPRGVYATSKLIGEWFAADAPSHYVLRVESLFGGVAAKSSVDVLRAGLLAGREVRAFADRTVSPSFVDDVAAASLSLVEARAPFGLYHCVNSGQTTWTELTREIARLLNCPATQVVPVNMADLALRVPRPLNAALSNAKLAATGIVMPDWRDALQRYLQRSI